MIKRYSIKKNTFIALFLAFGLLLSSCAKETKSDVVVYKNDFESGDLSNIAGGTIDTFNGTHVLGRYNNGSFNLTVNNLPKHDMVSISFDLYIHDSWDGNSTIANNLVGPDIWEMLIDNDPYINTTFSNEACAIGMICPPQAYPNDYPNNGSNPRTGAYNPNLPGACSLKSEPNGSSLYKIQKTFTHSKSSLVLKCLDKLMQKNTTDPKCDESWSVDNIQINVISL